MADNSVSIQVVAQVETAIRQFQDLGKSLQATMKTIGGSAAETVPSSLKAAGGVEAISGRLRDFKTESVQSVRSAAFFARQITDLGVVSKETSGIIGGLLGGFAIGGGIGIAMEAVKLIAEHFAKARAEAKALGEQLKTSSKEWRDYVFSLEATSESQRLLHKQLAPVEEKLDGLRKTLARLKSEHQEWNIVSDAYAIIGYDEVAAIEKQISAQEQLAETLKAQKGEADVAAQAVGAKKVLEQDLRDRVQLQMQHAVAMARLALENKTGEVKIEAEGEAQITEVRKRYAGERDADSINEKNQEIARIRANTALKVQLYRQESREIQELAAGADEAMTARAQPNPEWMVKARHEAQELAGDVKTAGMEVGDAFGKMAAGSATLTQALASSTKATLRLMLDMIMKTAMARAASAAIAAFESQGAIPIIGPVLGLAAMSAAYAAAMALIGSIPSAAGGYDIPRGVNPRVQLHQEEMVLSAPLANRVRAMTEAPSAGSIILNIKAYDRRGIAEFFNENKSHVMRAIRDGIRAGGQIR